MAKKAICFFLFFERIGIHLCAWCLTYINVKFFALFYPFVKGALNLGQTFEKGIESQFLGLYTGPCEPKFQQKCKGAKKKMNHKKQLAAGLLAGVLALGSAQSVLAATAHFNDSSVNGGSAEWQNWVSDWAVTAADFTKVSLTPGTDETQLNFAWYAKDAGAATPIVHFGTDKAALRAYKGTAAAVDASLTGDAKYVYNHVTVTGLNENTTYYYTVEKNGVQSAVETYKTGSFESVNILYVGDPQIGASKGQTQNGEKLVADSGAANTAARNDGFAWDRTLDIATAQNPNLNFVISAGDQVNKTGKAKEEEYASYLSASALSGLSVATTIGNHDSLNADYMYHFNNPNATSNGTTAAGGDYYYSYGSGLFIVLNTNNYNVAEHEATIKEAVASAPSAAWRVITIHQDIYGSGLDHSDTDGMILRTQLTPIIDKYDIDVVLQGHDHTYTRSKVLYGDSASHGSYEFQLNADGSDYDWDHAHNTVTDDLIPLDPADGDNAGETLLRNFQSDNLCYTIEQNAGNSITNPVGTLYMSANSASGSKFYELIASQQDYIAQRSQNWLPSYSVIHMTATSFSIDTYQVTDAGKAEKIDSTFTINKTGAAISSSTALTRAQAVQHIYNAAGCPAVSKAAGFSDVTASNSALKAIAWAKATGITKGIASSAFAPDAAVTVSQLNTMLARYAKASGKKAVSVAANTAAAADNALTKLGQQ
jgi:hypothetical protein